MGGELSWILDKYRTIQYLDRRRREGGGRRGGGGEGEEGVMM